MNAPALDFLKEIHQELRLSNDLKIIDLASKAENPAAFLELLDASDGTFLKLLRYVAELRPDVKKTLIERGMLDGVENI